MSVLLSLVLVAFVIASWTVAGLVVAFGKRLLDRHDHTPLEDRASSLHSVAVLAAVVPDLGAFEAGFEVGIFIVLFTIASVVVVNWIIRTIGGSD